MLLSCLDDNIFSPVIFSSDVEFYFFLLMELKIDNTREGGLAASEDRNPKMIKSIGNGKVFKELRNKNKSMMYNKENRHNFNAIINSINGGLK